MGIRNNGHYCVWRERHKSDCFRIAYGKAVLGAEGVQPIFAEASAIFRAALLTLSGPGIPRICCAFKSVVPSLCMDSQRRLFCCSEVFCCVNREQKKWGRFLSLGRQYAPTNK